MSLYRTAQISSEKLFTATNTAIASVRIGIGGMVGFKVIAKLLPFCLAIAKGIEKGVHEYKALTLKSGAFAGKGDTAKLEKFMALMMLVSGLVSAVPLITICIFFYQAFASQIFILVVMGIEISANKYGRFRFAQKARLG